MELHKHNSDVKSLRQHETSEICRQFAPDKPLRQPNDHAFATYAATSNDTSTPIVCHATGTACLMLR